MNILSLKLKFSASDLVSDILTPVPPDHRDLRHPTSAFRRAVLLNLAVPASQPALKAVLTLRLIVTPRRELSWFGAVIFVSFTLRRTFPVVRGFRAVAQRVYFLTHGSLLHRVSPTPPPLCSLQTTACTSYRNTYTACKALFIHVQHYPPSRT